jgi:hypothetical protein
VRLVLASAADQAPVKRTGASDVLRVRLLLTLVLLAVASMGQAQDIEPRSFSNAPIGVHFLLGGYAYTRGGLAFDPALPAKNPHLETSSSVLGYATVFDLWGLSAKFDAITGYSWLSGTATVADQPIERVVDGLTDARFRLSVNLYGAPALRMPEFRTYKQDLIIGASLQAFAPVGQYDSTRLVNLGTNRWAFKPQLGISQAIGPLTLELVPGVIFFADNTNFFGGRKRSQDPLYTVAGSAIYSFRSGIWASLDATFFTGGSTAINGVAGGDLQRNWRLGATLSFPLDARLSVKFYGSTGVSARTNNNYDLIGFLLQYRWGGGL